ncbi:MAG: SAF domain-containing protein [Acidimicrobiaceae bacterium]|nr:SAF domain-containing protein [Acidimicrobiaceae bacterium]MDE0606723.1 SAF domain-containing protein [Acidimicrobiaceae bacterium]
MTDTGTDGADAAGSAGTKRSIVSRRSLPNGRAVVGALLVTVAAVGAFVFANGGADGPNTEYLVLLRDVEAGDSISAADLAFEPMTLSPQLSDIAFEAASAESAGAVDGATALRFLHAGGLLLAPDVRDMAPIADLESTSLHELTLPVPLDRTPELLTRGDRVTVLAHDSRDQDTWVAFEDALVLEFHSGSDRIGASSDGRLTLGLSDPGRVLRGVHLSFLELTVVLTTRAAQDAFPEHYGGPVRADHLSEIGGILDER